MDPTSNFSTCAYINNKGLVCYTYCNSTDLCNGPQRPPVKKDPCAHYTLNMTLNPDLYDIPEFCGAVSLNYKMCVVAMVITIIINLFHRCC